jgi:hypothetical protein
MVTHDSCPDLGISLELINIALQLYQKYFFRALLKEVKKAGEIHIVLDCSTEKIQDILKQASQVGMMTAYHNYLITSLVIVIPRK